MRLEKSRKALTLAEKYLGILEELADDPDPEAFQDSFVGAIAAIRRVGHAVDFESKKLGRTPKFSQLWAEASKDRRYLCVKDARDLVLHESEEGTYVHHEAHTVGTAMVRATAYNPTVITNETHIDVVRDGQELERFAFSSTPPPPKAKQAGPTYRRTWVFAKGECAGDELIPALRRYLEWMRDDVIPKAEAVD